MPNEMILDRREHSSLPSSAWGYLLSACAVIIKFSDRISVPVNADIHHYVVAFLKSPASPVYVIAAIYVIAEGYFYYFIYRIHRTLREVSGGNYPIGPIKAVGFHFIPFFSWYWVFAWTNSISEFINSMQSHFRMRKWLAGAGLLIAFIIMTRDAAIGIAAQFCVLQYIKANLDHALHGKRITASRQVSPGHLGLFAGLGSGFALLAVLGIYDLFFEQQKRQNGYYELAAILIASAGALMFVEPLIKQLKSIFGITEEERFTQGLPKWRLPVVGFFAIACLGISHAALDKIIEQMFDFNNPRLRDFVTVAFGILVPGAITWAWISKIQQGRSAAWAGGCVGMILAIMVVIVKSIIFVPHVPPNHKVLMAIGSACQYGACGFVGGLALDRRWGSSAIHGIEFALLGVTAVVVAVIVPVDHFISDVHHERKETLIYFARVVGWSCGILALKPTAEALLRPGSHRRADA